VRALAVTIDRARVCIIVLKWNRRDKALACLESLARGPRGFPASSSSTTARATARRRRSARASPPWRRCRSRRNRGYAGGNNASCGSPSSTAPRRFSCDVAGPREALSARAARARDPRQADGPWSPRSRGTITR